MLFRLSMATAPIAATVVIQAPFMSAGLNTFNWIEENKEESFTRCFGGITLAWEWTEVPSPSDLKRLLDVLQSYPDPS